MWSLLGAPDEPWSLVRAVDSMRDAARAAGRPGLIWIAGIVYPSLYVGSTLTIHREVIHSAGVEESVGRHPLLFLLFGGSLVLVLFLPIYGRLMAGLARLSPPRVWEQLAGPRGAPSLRTVWQAGRGLTCSALGLWILLGLLQRGAALLVLGAALRVAFLASEVGGHTLAGLFLLVLAGPFVALVALYAVVISVLHQLALHSLAHNRRGVASALLHAWRIARHDPWATGRGVAVDLVLVGSILVLSWAMAVGLGVTCLGSVGLGTLIALALSGFAGVARAGFWARAYRALGGLSPDDGVPGLEH